MKGSLMNAHYGNVSVQKVRQALCACVDDQGPGYRLGTHCDGRDLGCVRLKLAVGTVSVPIRKVPPNIPAAKAAVHEESVAVYELYR